MEFVDKAIAFVSCPPPSLISLAVTIPDSLELSAGALGFVNHGHSELVGGPELLPHDVSLLASEGASLGAHQDRGGFHLQAISKLLEMNSYQIEICKSYKQTWYSMPWSFITARLKVVALSFAMMM